MWFTIVIEGQTYVTDADGYDRYIDKMYGGK